MAAANPDGFTEILTNAGVLPEVGLTVSHDPPETVTGVALKVSPALPPMVTDCGAGVVPPI